ncbi:S-methyl-5'-thioadenosine phosphorylase [Carlito syrichta]|uniref:S-methyl-5'-thioadenosine phosphorylase n=1 Tax=Carlito syrichta TaxID=1868482 RepID=A0A3Q0DX45_CARSF|nr:S-methyl-5'-thioadenosine phosphorylase [Carlito syrichta]
MRNPPAPRPPSVCSGGKRKPRPRRGPAPCEHPRSLSLRGQLPPGEGPPSRENFWNAAGPGLQPRPWSPRIPDRAGGAAALPERVFDVGKPFGDGDGGWVGAARTPPPCVSATLLPGEAPGGGQQVSRVPGRLRLLEPAARAWRDSRFRWLCPRPTWELCIGIIGGTGLDDPEILEGRTEKYVDTPFGKPSDALILGKIKNVDCVLLARHGRQHTILPSKVNYQANIWALKEEGCTHVIVTTACGSLREEIQPGDIVIIDQFIDRTTMRPQTFYDGSHSCARGVCHIPMAEPFCPKTREVLTETAKKLGLRCHSKGTMVTIEGPRFSSRAESFMFRTWGADVINMTTVPEVVLAKEAGICYASIAMATDYDCWKEHEEAVSVDRVLKTLKENANKAKSLLLTTIPQIGSMEWSETLHNLKNMAQFSVLLPRH